MSGQPAKLTAKCKRNMLSWLKRLERACRLRNRAEILNLYDENTALDADWNDMGEETAREYEDLVHRANIILGI